MRVPLIDAVASKPPLRLRAVIINIKQINIGRNEKKNFQLIEVIS